jgi:hypothetical protein
MKIQNDFYDDLHGQVSVLVETGYSDAEIHEEIDADPEILGELIDTIRNE